MHTGVCMYAHLLARLRQHGWTDLLKIIGLRGMLTRRYVYFD